jgi:hypothetical protein
MKANVGGETPNLVNLICQLHALATLIPWQQTRHILNPITDLDVGSREKSLASAWNKIVIPLLSSLWPSQYTD